MPDGGTAASFFDATAKRYDSAYDAQTADGHALRARMAVVLRLVGEGPGAALDAGMGPGRLCAELESRGWTAHGVDAAPEMVSAARGRLPVAADRLLVGRIESLPFPDARFDVVVATGVLEYAQLPAALRELARVLRPGGRAVVSYPNPVAAYGIWKTRLYYPAVRVVKTVLGRGRNAVPPGTGRIRPRPFQALLAEAGLEAQTVEYTSYLPVLSPLELLVPRLAMRAGERLEGSGVRLGAALATQVVYEAQNG